MTNLFQLFNPHKGWENAVIRQKLLVCSIPFLLLGWVLIAHYAESFSYTFVNLAMGFTVAYGAVALYALARILRPCEKSSLFTTIRHFFAALATSMMSVVAISWTLGNLPFGPALLAIVLYYSGGIFVFSTLIAKVADIIATYFEEREMENH